MFNALWLKFGGYALNYEAPPYNILNHPLLSPSARRLSSTVLKAQGAVAQELLGLTGTSFTGTAGKRVTDAIVLQVNYQLEAGVDAAVYQSKGRGARSVTYRGSIVNPTAAAIVAQVFAALGIGGYGVLISRRPLQRT